MKERAIIKSSKADWRLVAAAMAMRSNAYSDEMDAAAAMGKKVSQRRDVAQWSAKLGQLSWNAEQHEPRRSMRLLVQPDWIEKHASNLSGIMAESPVPTFIF